MGVYGAVGLDMNLILGVSSGLLLLTALGAGYCYKKKRGDKSRRNVNAIRRNDDSTPEFATLAAIQIENEGAHEVAINVANKKMPDPAAAEKTARKDRRKAQAKQEKATLKQKTKKHSRRERKGHRRHRSAK